MVSSIKNFSYSLVAVFLALPSFAAAFPIRIQNHCAFPIWPAATQAKFGPDDGKPFVLMPYRYTAAYLAPGETTTFFAPSTWRAGRVWARTGCNADATQCETGGCGAFHCPNDSYELGVTLAEFSYGNYMGKDLV